MEPIPRTDDPWSRSQLFTVRVWVEEADAGRSEARMQVRHVLSGETRYFGAWPPLIDHLLSKLDAPPAPQDRG